jgi:hypothetical protein
MKRNKKVPVGVKMNREGSRVKNNKGKKSEARMGE